MKLNTYSLARTAIAACLFTGTMLNASAAGLQPLDPAPAASSATNVTVPRLVAFAGSIPNAAGKPQAGATTLTFSLYEQQEGGDPLWAEDQTVRLDEHGSYSVYLGASNPTGLPVNLFASGKARWLGVSAQSPGEIEQPRVLMVAIPYALKAVDADTLGGKPASAFLTAAAQTDRRGDPGKANPVGTITGVSAGSGLTGGGSSGNVTLSLDLAKTSSWYSQLHATNLFTRNQSFSGSGQTATIGDMGCNSPSAGISFGNPGTCTDYALLGFNGDTMLNSPLWKTIYLRNGNYDVMSVTRQSIQAFAPLTITTSTDGIVANATLYQGATGVTGQSLRGVGIEGIATDLNSWAVYGTAPQGGTAGNFEGNVFVSGGLSASAKYFKIDHPADPSNKYLVHASIESSEMINIYSGNIRLDQSGAAVVTLPDWFETLNTDFRYELTCIGGSAPVYIADEIAGHTFRIAGGRAGLKVSWQITGVRQDPWAKAHPMTVELDKTEEEQGHFLSPELYGKSREASISVAHRAAQRASQHTPSTK